MVKGQTTPFIQMKKIAMRFGGIQALSEVDFHIEAGEIVGLVGDNGAGKSTLIKILAGVYSPDQGSIYINGSKIQFEGPRHAKELGIETVHQDRGLIPGFRVTSNIFLGREKTRFGLLRLRCMDQLAQESVESLGIEIQSFRAPVINMSGGQQQAVAVARALSTNPKIVILDEPTAALAVKEVNKVLDVIRRLQEHGVAVVLISHVIPEVLAVTDRIVVLRRGQTVGDLATRDSNQELVVKLMIGTEVVGCAG
jgi:D-xylose transport system ATP-binding protein